MSQKPCTCGGGIGIISYDGPDELFNRLRKLSRMFRTMRKLVEEDDT